MVIYETLKEVPSNKSVIPNGCLSFAEQSLYVAEFVEEAFNEMFKSIGIDELAVFESTGSFVVYEGAKLEDFKKKAIKLFQDIWGAIKSAYEKILGYFKEAQKKKIDKVTDDVINNLDDSKVYGKTHQFDMSLLDDMKSNSESYTSKIKTEFKKMLDEENYSEKVKEKSDEFEAEIPSKISGIADAKTVKEAKSKLYEKMIGAEIEVNKNWLKSNYKDMIDVVNGKETTNKISEAYKAEKKEIEKIISDLKNIKKEADDKDTISTIKYIVKTWKSMIQCLHSCASTFNDVNKKRYNEYRVILFRISNLSSKKVESKNESYDFQDNQQELIESVFNW